MLPDSFDALIQTELQRRLNELRTRTYGELLALPDTKSEDVQMEGVQATFTVIRNLAEDGRLLVLVRSDRQQLLGLITSGTTEGFWISPSGQTVDALYQDIEDVL